MISYQKYLVSQHFGKALATVELGETSGCVTITVTHPDERNVKFHFQNSRAGRFIKDHEHEVETVTRLAIQQAHKIFTSKGLEILTGSEHELAVEGCPWIGDLTEVPYGGATSGYQCALASAFAGAAAAHVAPRPA